MKDNLYTLGYAAVLGAVCALLLTGASEITKSYREANARAEETRNILAVLDVPFERKASARSLLTTYDQNVRRETLGDLTTYAYVTPGTSEVRATAFPISGQGVWGPIHGFLSLEPDMKTIRRLIFFDQSETPGLGGEIASSWFQDQFKGKSIGSSAGGLGIRILQKGGASASNEVDGITGATMTCNKVEKMLNTTIERIAQESSEDVR